MMLLLADMRSTSPRFTFPVLAALASGGWGCAHKSVEAPTAGPEKTRVAVPCPQLSARRRNVESERVFLEIAEVVSDGDPQPLEETLRERPVIVRTGSGSLASDHETVSLPWRWCLDPQCKSETPATLRATPKLPSMPAEPITIVVELASKDAPPYVQTTVSARDQRPSVVSKLHTPDGAYVSTLVVTPYLVDGQDDLRSLLTCKKKVNEAMR